jgi:multiple sugar transport system substrate-binding protein
MVEERAASVNFSRRGFLGAVGAAAALPLLAACGSSGGSGGSSSSGKSLKFWDMPWGGDKYNPAAKALVATYKPTGSNLPATYQEIQWANFTQTFSSAIASKTGPAVSTGGGFQAFQYAQQGAIAYADNLIKTMQSDGTYDDFLPNMIDAMKTSEGYAAVPWQLDIRVWWYNKAIFDQLNLQPPTTWDELKSVGQELKGKGYYGFAAGAGAGNNLGAHAMVMMMINNGGGLFGSDGKLNIVNDQNIQAMQFVNSLVKAKIVDPRSVSYTGDNQNAQWKNKKFAMGIDTAGLDGNIGDTSGDLVLMKPLTAPNGDKACLVFENNIMMYKNTPSQASSEAFLLWYIKNMKAYWQQNLLSGLPVLKSIVALPGFQAQKNKVAAITDWVPVAKTYAAQGTELSPALAQVDGGQPLQAFTQTILGGGDPKGALTTLQNTLSSIVKS